MATVNRKRSMAQAEYVSGTAARKLQAVERPAIRNERHTVTIRREQDKALPMDLPFVIMLTIAAINCMHARINIIIEMNFIRRESSIITGLEFE